MSRSWPTCLNSSRSGDLIYNLHIYVIYTVLRMLLYNIYIVAYVICNLFLCPRYCHMRIILNLCSRAQGTCPSSITRCRPRQKPGAGREEGRKRTLPPSVRVAGRPAPTSRAASGTRGTQCLRHLRPGVLGLGYWPLPDTHSSWCGHGTSPASFESHVSFDLSLLALGDVSKARDYHPV